MAMNDLRGVIARQASRLVEAKTEIVGGARGRITLTQIKALEAELDAQGEDSLSPIRHVLRHPGYFMAVSRDSSGRIVGALAFESDRTGVHLVDLRAMTRGTGIGKELLVAAAQMANGKEMRVTSAVPSAVPFYQRMGAVFFAKAVNSMPGAPKRWGGYGVWDPEAVRALASGNPIDKTASEDEPLDIWGQPTRLSGHPEFFPGQDYEASKKTAMAAEVLPGVTTTKDDGRYYVAVDGVTCGWVLKASSGWWRFFATIHQPYEGERLSEERTRTEAIAEGLSTLGIRHLGRFLAIDRDKDSPTYMEHVSTWIEPERLRKVWDDHLTKKYGE